MNYNLSEYFTDTEIQNAYEWILNSSNDCQMAIADGWLHGQGMFYKVIDDKEFRYYYDTLQLHVLQKNKRTIYYEVYEKDLNKI